MLNLLPELPTGLLQLPASRLHTLLPGPSLIHLPGRQPAPLFVSVLLHGNEDTGWEALRALLQRYRDRQLPRALSCFIGNVGAAATGCRHLPGQADFNRIWDGGSGEEQRMAARVLEEMRRRGVFASIDIHNNTGRNPHYACVNRTDPGWLNLAALFSRTVVYFTRPSSVLSLAMARLCPSVTLECGQVGDANGIVHALDYLETCLRLRQLPTRALTPVDIDLFHTDAVVKLRQDVDFGFGPGHHDLQLASGLEHYNFRVLPAGTRIGTCNDDRGLPLEVFDVTGRAVADRYLRLEDRQILTRTELVPAMLTRDQTVIRQDCLCYLMQRYPCPA